MSFAAVGSIAFDSVRTPFGRGERELGGSATYSALAASLFTDVYAVGAVGEDFGPEHRQVFADRGIDVAGIELVKGKETFFWRARYEFDLNVAYSEEIRLNAFAGWKPILPITARDADMLFLGNMDPELQMSAREQWRGQKWCALDSMSYWIQNRREALVQAIEQADIVLMNDQEVRELTAEPMLLRAARRIISWGPQAVVVKQGEYGVVLLTGEGYFALPGYPLEVAVDPTGTGDAFAGGFLGYLDRQPGTELTEGVLRTAVTYGSVMASFCTEEPGPGRLARLTELEVNHRFDEFKEITHFEHVPTGERPHIAEEEHPALERPAPTPGTRGYDPIAPTPATPGYRSPKRTPSTEPIPKPGHPLPPRPE